VAFDGKQFGQDIVSEVKKYVERKTAPLEEEVKRLQDRVSELEDKPRVRMQAESRRL